MKTLVYLILLTCSAALQSADAQGAEKRPTGNTCSQDAECPDNAFCKAASYCVCKEGYIFAKSPAISDDAACLKVGTLGDTCTLDVQCHFTMGVHAVCRQGKCVCQEETQFVAERCYRKASIGERCLVDHNCHLSDPLTDEQAYCGRGYCICPVQFSPRNNGTRCTRDAELYERCIDTAQCAGVGLVCKKICVCAEGFTAYNESSICVPTVKELGAKCDFDIQCSTMAGVKNPKFAQGSTVCVGGVCTCGYEARVAGEPARCYNVRRPGDACQSDHECLEEEDGPGFCRGGRCNCHNCTPDANDFNAAGSQSPRVALISAILAAAAAIFKFDNLKF